MNTRGAVLLLALLASQPARAADPGQGMGEALGFGMYGKLGLGMTLAAAGAPLAALAPAIAPPGPVAAGESVRIVGPYRWADCMLDISFYFRGPGPEGERKLQTVLLQTVNDSQQLCRAEMEDQVDDIAPGHVASGPLTPSQGRAYAATGWGQKAIVVWPKQIPPMKLFATSAAIEPRQSTPFTRYDALPLPKGVITLSQFAVRLDPNPPDISFVLAKEAAEAALAACHQDRAAIVATVLGPRGGPKVLLSSENNDPFDYVDGSAVGYDRVRMKAYVVLQTGKPSRAYTERKLPTNGGSADGFLHATPLSAADLAGGPGALPLWRGDVLAGVISVDGALDARQDDDFNEDEACAQAGIDSIKDRLLPLKR